MDGRLSYPVYLLHLVVYGIATDRGLITPEMSPRNGLVVLGLSFAAALVVSILVDMPIQRLRSFIRAIRSRQATPRRNPVRADPRSVIVR